MPNRVLQLLVQDTLRDLFSAKLNEDLTVGEALLVGKLKFDELFFEFSTQIRISQSALYSLRKEEK